MFALHFLPSCLPWPLLDTPWPGCREPPHALFLYPHHFLRESQTLPDSRFCLVSPKSFRHHLGGGGNLISASKVAEVLFQEKQPSNPSDICYSALLTGTREHALPMRPSIDHPDPVTVFRVWHQLPPKCLRSKISSHYCPEINYL